MAPHDSSEPTLGDVISAVRGLGDRMDAEFVKVHDAIHVLGVRLEQTQTDLRIVIEGQINLGERLDRRIDALEKKVSEDIEDLRGAVRQNSVDIEKNSAAIRKNTSAIKKNSADIRQSSADIRKNSADIRQNSTDIRQNSADIRKNSADIQELRVEVAGVRSDFNQPPSGEFESDFRTAASCSRARGPTFPAPRHSPWRRAFG